MAFKVLIASSLIFISAVLSSKIEKLNIWISLEPCEACSTKLSENLDISKVIYFEKWPKLREKGLSLLREKCEVLNGNKVINK